MKAKNISKRVLSVILCTVMLFSCWVFTAPTASVSSAAAGNYYYRVTYKFPQTSNLNGTYKGWNSSGSFQGSDDSWGISFRYKGDNGNASSYSYANVQPSVIGSQTTYSGTLSGFPDRMLVTLDDNCPWYPLGTPCKLEVYKLEIGSSASNLKTVWTGTVHLESWTGEYSVYVDIDGKTGWVKGKSGGGEYVNNSNSSSWTWPKVNSMDDPTGDATVYVNTNGATSNTYTYTAGAVKDDYGVRWYQDATLASNSMQNGVSFSSPTLTVPGSANRAANYNVSIKQTFSGLTQKTKTITVSVFKYNVTFYSDSSKSTIWKVNNKDTNAYDYNAAITLPHATGWLNTDKSTASNHYTISNYYENDSTAIPSGNKLTSGAQTRGFYPKYTETAHSFVYDSSVAITDTQHQVKCSTSGCGYTKKVNHTYNQDTVRDATTQVTAPTCTTAGTYKKTCVCGKVDPTNNSVYTPTSGTGTALSHAWTAAEYDGVTSLKTAADCLNNAIYYKVCSRCHQVHTTDTWVKTGTALGHSFPNTWDPFTGNENPHGTTYNGDEYHKHTCNYASCPGDTVQDKNGKWQTEYDTHTWSQTYYYAAPENDGSRINTIVLGILQDDGMLDAEGKFIDTDKCYRYCTACGYVEYSAAHNFVGEVTKEATCLTKGEMTYTCSYCNKSYTGEIPVTPHTWVRWEGCSEEKVSGLNDSVPVVFECQNGCGNYCAATYDEEAKKYNPTEIFGKYDDVKGYSDQIQTPTFNEHTEYFGKKYSYADRKASLRVRLSEKGDDTQAMRFSGNISAYNIADKVSFEVNPDKIYDNNELMSLAEIRAKNKADKTAFEDNTVIDFGFVYTQAKYIRSAKETINYDLLTLDYMGKNNPATKQDCRIYRMSVVENNKGNGTLSNNWKGLTDCYNYPTEEAGEEGQYTFNLVINVNVKNYQATYCARTYIIYKYHGDIICVYDQPELNETPIHSHDSVYNQAIKNEATGKLPETVVDYLDYKIINRTIEGKERYIKQSFIDWDWNYKLTNFKKIKEQNS